jgi:Tfp pilus assembly protein PilV
MKKILIALFIVAAAGTAFYLLNRKSKATENSTQNKELILGKWKTAMMGTAADSAKTTWQYEFQKDGIVLRASGDTVKADTTHYSWNKSGALVWKENAGDTAGKIYTVVKLTADSLELKADLPAENILCTKLK